MCKQAMITSGAGTGTTAATSSRIPVAKHRQTSPEQFSNHNYFQQVPAQPHHVSRHPKSQVNSGSQHDSAVSSGGGSSGVASGESEGESSGVNNNKRRKDSAGSITGIHGMPGN